MNGVWNERRLGAPTRVMRHPSCDRPVSDTRNVALPSGRRNGVSQVQKLVIELLEANERKLDSTLQAFVPVGDEPLLVDAAD